MKRAHLRWLMPITIYLIAMAMLLTIHSNSSYQRAALVKQQEIILEISRAVKSVNEKCGSSQAVVGTSATAISLYALEYNKNQIVRLMQSIVDSSEVTEVIVCGADGLGYDQTGMDVSIAQEDYFEELSREYSSGGLGMMYQDVEDEDAGVVLIVGSVTFAKRENGYIVASLPLAPLLHQFMDTDFLADKQALITMNGTIIMEKTADMEQEDIGGLFWDQLPTGLSRDAIKLSISQNNMYLSQVPGYGYVAVAPLSTVNAAGVALITKEQMDIMLQDDLSHDRLLIAEIAILSVALIAAVFLSNLISDRIMQRQKEKRQERLETDPLTGLLTRRSVVTEIDRYIESGEKKRGIIFVMALSAIQDMKKLKGEEFINDRSKDFSRLLRSNYRSTDILGRLKEDVYVVFVKDIFEDKDVRKQTDHMQLFLHDTNPEDMGDNAFISVGAALYPDSGHSAVEILVAAEKAMLRAKKEEKSRLSF